MSAGGREVGFKYAADTGSQVAHIPSSECLIKWAAKETKQNPRYSIHSIYKLHFVLVRGNCSGFFLWIFTSRLDLTVWCLARPLFSLLHVRWKLVCELFFLLKCVMQNYHLNVSRIYIAFVTVFITVAVTVVAVSSRSTVEAVVIDNSNCRRSRCSST